METEGEFQEIVSKKLSTVIPQDFSRHLSKRRFIIHVPNSVKKISLKEKDKGKIKKEEMLLVYMCVLGAVSESEIGPQTIAQADLKFTVCPRLASDSWQSTCLSFLSAGMTGVSHHACLLDLLILL